jgi:hypothetical protein
MAKRELIEPKPGDNRYVRRDEKGAVQRRAGRRGQVARLGIAANMPSMKRRMGKETVAIVGRQRSRTHRHTVGVAV